MVLSKLPEIDLVILLAEVAEALEPFVKSPITWGKRFSDTSKDQHIVAGVTVGDWDRLIDVATRLRAHYDYLPPCHRLHAEGF